MEAIASNLTASPSADPIQLPDFAAVFANAGQLAQDMSSDFNPFATGSFLFWGAPTLYSIPAAIGGTIQDFTGIPNQFINPDINPNPDIGWQPLGAEPVTGYTDGPSSLLTGLPTGFEYLGQGLLGYLNPEIYLQAVENDFGLLTNPTALLDEIPLLGYLFDPSTLGLGSFDLVRTAGVSGPKHTARIARPNDTARIARPNDTARIARPNDTAWIVRP